MSEQTIDETTGVESQDSNGSKPRSNAHTLAVPMTPDSYRRLKVHALLTDDKAPKLAARILAEWVDANAAQVPGQ